MLLKISITLIVLSANSRAFESATYASYENALVCLRNKTVLVGIATSYQSCQVRQIFAPKIRDDYTLTPGVGAYKLHTLAKTWNVARKICENEGAHLAILNSKAEHNAIAELLAKEGQYISNAPRPDIIWLGGHNLYDANDWVSVNGKSLSSSGYVNWSKGCLGYAPEPNNPNTERCLSLYHRSCKGLNDYSCDAPSAFVCERSDVCSL